MNKQLLFVKRPEGEADASTWSLETNPIPEISEGQILVKQHYVSLDPAMRGWMNEGKSYIAPMEIGSVMRAGSVGEVVASNNEKFQVGQYVAGTGGVQQYAVTDGKGFYPVDPKLAPLPMYIGTLGMPGMTAYFGITEVGKVKEGDTVLVSGAAEVVGIAGGPDKCKYVVEELGFDACIDYKNENVATRFKEECPKGIDIYFDNVGGEILDIALTRLRMNARIVICGAISQYNNKTKVKGPSNYLSLLVNRASMTGMVVFDYASRYAEGAQILGGWMAQGKLKSREDVYEGIENFPETYSRLFSGDKMGKLVLKIIED